jgi:hypothetical protein
MKWANRPIQLNAHETQKSRKLVKSNHRYAMSQDVEMIVESRSKLIIGHMPTHPNQRNSGGSLLTIEQKGQN